MQELTRFPNTIKKIRDHYFWNIFDLFEEIKTALATCAKDNIKVESIGIDTWGVDFAMVGEDGMILGLPYAYRDPHTDGMPEDYFKNVLSRDKVYGITGIQIMNFNSLFQIYAMKKENSSMLKTADKLLFIPDALSYLLTGKMVTEYTIASTSQILNPLNKEMDNSLLKAMGIEKNLFNPIVYPGVEIGRLTDDIVKETGVENIPVIAVAGHDTASAVAAVPAKNEKFAYLSSGTWSLMGIETKDPIINERSMELNFTNEGGIEGTTRFLKNITGMWILEQCRKEWDKDVQYSYPEIVAMSQSAAPFKCMIDPDHPSFANPESMTRAICDYCEATGQPKPETHAEFIRMIFESLALKYRVVIEMLKSVAPFDIEVLHVIGGGSKNDLLNQLTSNAIGLPVVSGPSEATAIGNIMIQAQAAGIVNSLQKMRNIIAGSIDSKEYQPQEPAVWEEAYNKFKKVCKL